MAHELHDDGFHEIQLSGKQLVFLFMATTVVSAVIFLCGILVGRGVHTARGLSGTGIADATSIGVDDDTAAAPSTGEPTPVAGLSYPETLPARDAAPAPVAAGAASDLASTTTPAPTPPPSVEPTPAPTELAKAAPPTPAPPPATPAAAPTATPAAPPAPAEDGGFTVQVTALKNRPEADAIAQRLQSRGYKAYVVAPPAGGQVIYKVRVGMDLQRQEADAVMRRLQKEEKFKPWITR
ncbi:MAG: SPOR domain-containing protein [Acidobacteria bacterium]|nr:SPOR domain-containing protein [Acidobacteriota bacterium]